MRNRRMADALRQPTLKHRLRDNLLSAIANLPVFPQRTESNRLLVIRPDHVGDVLLTTPAIQAIKRKRPDIIIHVLCGEWSADVLSNFPEIDQVLTIPFPGFTRRSSGGKNAYLQALQSARMLRQIGYRSAIIMRPDHWWGAMLAFLAGIPERTGYDLPNVSPFLTTAYPHLHDHAVKQNLRLAQHWIGDIKPDDVKLYFPVIAEDKEYIAKYLSDWNIQPDKNLVCIHPGSGAASKLWSADKWAAVADAVAAENETAVIFTGSASEKALIHDIAAKMKSDAYIIAGSTSLGQLAALYQRSLVVLGPDSGAMHLAAAVDTPTVSLFGPADPIEFAPWGDPDRHAVVTSQIACRPCRILDWPGDDPDYHPCVREIAIDQVWTQPLAS